jgi:hypothetical protein
MPPRPPKNAASPIWSRCGVGPMCCIGQQMLHGMGPPRSISRSAVCLTLLKMHVLPDSLWGKISRSPTAPPAAHRLCKPRVKPRRNCMPPTFKVVLSNWLPTTNVSRPRSPPPPHLSTASLHGVAFGETPKPQIQAVDHHSFKEDPNPPFAPWDTPDGTPPPPQLAPGPYDPNPRFPGRNNLGRFGSGNTGSADGAAAAEARLQQEEADTGKTLVRQQIRVAIIDPNTGKPMVDPETGNPRYRYYDALEPTGVPGQYIGIEVKSGSADLTRTQRIFDTTVSPQTPATGHRGLLARRSTDPRPGGRPASDHPYIKHASAAMTLDVYADLFDSDLSSVAESVGKMWARQAQPNEHSTLIHALPAPTGTESRSPLSGLN